MRSTPPLSRDFFRAPFCERYFGIFFVVWGLILILDHFLSIAAYGLFLGRLESYFPGWTWGVILLAIGMGRYVAFKLHCNSWRVLLSGATLVVLTVIASVAVFTRLWAATAPLSVFVAAISYWSHKALLRDLRYGL